MKADINANTQLEMVEYDPYLDIRRAMVANCMSVVGIAGGDPKTEPIFQRLLGPAKVPWTLGKPYGQGGISTCSMVALGLLRRLGVASKEVMGSYRIGAGLGDARAFAKRCVPSAWVTPTGSMRPKPGDVVDLKPRDLTQAEKDEGKKQTDLSNHTDVVVGWEGNTVVCVAGGQVTTRWLQTIKVVRRVWQVTGKATAPRSGGREVDGWIDLERLPIDGPLVVPMGWEAMEL